MAKVWPERACGYGRVSTKKQEEGLDSQVFSIERLAKQHGVALVKPPFAEGALWEDFPIPEREWVKAQEYPDFWCDFGVSGATMERPMFKAMIQYMKDNDIHDVIMYDTSRLSRDMRNALNFVHEARHGEFRINIHFSSMPELDLDDPVQEGQFGMMGLMDQMQRRITVKKTQDAMLRLQEDGAEWVGRPPYGLYAGKKGDIGDKGKLYYNSQEIEVLNEILREYTRNPSYNGVARYLNSRNYKTRSGGEWSAQQVKRVVNHAIEAKHIDGERILEFFPEDMLWRDDE
jgi:DNA invertase Pin-like site-specific DNA recombinase